VRTRLQKVIFWLGRQRWWSWLMSHVLPPTDRFLHRITRGRATVTQLVLPVLMLTTTGRKTGRRRETPLTYIEVDDSLAVAASSFGRGGHPAWSHNLLANPDAEVTIDDATVPVRARLVDPETRDRLMPRFIEVYPPYRLYIERLTDRDIRVFVLDPVDTTSKSSDSGSRS
jgi:deazaflavin-dependent oxidoreductase (nitroreductase family)